MSDWMATRTSSAPRCSHLRRRGVVAGLGLALAVLLARATLQQQARAEVPRGTVREALERFARANDSPVIVGFDSDAQTAKPVVLPAEGAKEAAELAAALGAPLVRDGGSALLLSSTGAGFLDRQTPRSSQRAAEVLGFFDALPRAQCEALLSDAGLPAAEPSQATKAALLDLFHRQAPGFADEKSRDAWLEKGLLRIRAEPALRLFAGGSSTVYPVDLALKRHNQAKGVEGQ